MSDSKRERKLGLRLGEIAEAVGGDLRGSADLLITGAASVEDASIGDIVFGESDKYLRMADKSDASAVVAKKGSSCQKPAVLVDDVRLAFAKILELFAVEERRPPLGVDPSSRVGERFNLGEGSAVGFGCWIGDDVSIGRRSVIHPLVYIGDGVSIGDDCVIKPNVTVLYGCKIGDRVIIHPGAVIGSDGFGYVTGSSGALKIPHIGGVIIGDDVEIGACTAIDRAKTGFTQIGSGVKIDNLVHVAHNVKIGTNCLIAAQTGIAGSSQVGKNVMLAGQTGVKDHVRIGDGAVITADAGVIGDVPDGEMYSGYPARPHRQWLRSQAAIVRLEEALDEIKRLRQEVDSLKSLVERLDVR